MYNEQLEKLIEMALLDGELTEKEKQVLFKKAESFGVDLDEFEMVLDSKLFEIQKKAKSESSAVPPPAAAPKSDKFGDVRKCPSCAAVLQSFQTKCDDCGHEFRNIDAVGSSQKLFDLLQSATLRNSKALSENEEQKNITFLSVMMANNETGVIQDMPAIIKWAKSHNIQIHTDAVQAIGKINVDFEELGVDAMTISSHKIYGPQGAAALILNKKIDLYPHLMGGGQEKGLRSGTENIAAIVGFGKACERVQKNVVIINNEVKQERLLLEKELKKLGAVIFAEETQRLGNTTFFAFNNIDGSTLLTALDRKGYAIASGSACSSNSTDASHVLLAMGIEPELAQGALRVSLGVETKKEEVKSFVEILKVEVNRLKQLTAIAA